MLEREKVEYKFRGHHAPCWLFSMFGDLNDFQKNLVIQDFLKTNDWAKTTGVSFLNRRLDILKVQKPAMFMQGMTLRNDRDYVVDVFGKENPDINEVKIIVDEVLGGVSQILDGKPGQEVMVGSLLDNVCKKCVWGKHCTAVDPRGTSEDHALAGSIDFSLKQLTQPVRLEESPDGMFYSDGRNTKKEQVSVLFLGDLRDFILRRWMNSLDMEHSLINQINEIAVCYVGSDKIIHEVMKEKEKLFRLRLESLWDLTDPRTMSLVFGTERRMQQRIDEVRRS